MDDLMTFLRARLDEDGQIAQAATSGPWSRMGQAVLDPNPPSDRLGIGMAVGHAAATADYNETAEHIARHDPARVIAEVEAKRGVLAMAEEATRDVASPDHLVNGPARMQLVVLEAILRHLAFPYADHPDYREEWRPWRGRWHSVLYVVTGPPTAGKSTWIQARAKLRDIVIDLDRIALALAGPGADHQSEALLSLARAHDLIEDEPMSNTAKRAHENLILDWMMAYEMMALVQIDEPHPAGVVAGWGMDEGSPPGRE